eukprot:g2921.t1
MWETVRKILANRRNAAIIAVAAAVAALLRRASAKGAPASPPRSFTKFLEDLRANRVSSILMRDDNFRVSLRPNANAAATGVYETNVVPLLLRVCGPEIVSLISKHAVAIRTPSKGLREKIFPLLLLMLPFVYLIVSVRMLKNTYSSKNEVGRKPQRTDRRSFPRFSDVAGIDAAKVEMQEVVSFLRDPSRYRRVGAKLPKGILLWGPSGTGKTLLARAVAAEANVAFFSCSASDFVEMLVGRGAARVRDLFQRASKHRGPAIVFIDELDALGKARGGLNSHDEREQTLNQLLTEMDGFDSATDPSQAVLVIAATNRPRVLDPALIRPGRFDRHIHVGLPDEKGREAVLRVHSRQVKISANVNFRSIARRTEGRSGADLACLVNEAALLAVRTQKTEVDQSSFELALRRKGTIGK